MKKFYNKAVSSIIFQGYKLLHHHERCHFIVGGKN